MQTHHHVSTMETMRPLDRVHALHQRPHTAEIRVRPEMTLGTAGIASALNVTETEARLALALSRGQTIKDFARAQGCTWNTARTHARNLLAKTSCHRQAELVLLVHGLL